MAGLVIEGDPGGWADIGGVLRALAARLEGELAHADMVGAKALERSWTGPAATAFSVHWASRRPRYEEVISAGLRAAQAITAYGHALEDMRVRAANLESTWCGVGLHLLYSGEGFTAPPGLETMPPPAQASLKQALFDSARDIEGLGADGVAAATDLAAVLGPVVLLLEDFQFIELGLAWGVASRYIDDLRKPDTFARAGLEVAERNARAIADQAGAEASQLARDLRSGTPEERSAAAPLLPETGHDAAYARRVSGLAKVGGRLLLVGANVSTAAEVFSDARREGWRASLEQNAGDIASTATDDIITVCFPGVGVLAGGVIAAGVGYTVQSVVNDRKSIGHFAESIF